LACAEEMADVSDSLKSGSMSMSPLPPPPPPPPDVEDDESLKDPTM